MTRGLFYVSLPYHGHTPPSRRSSSAHDPQTPLSLFSLPLPPATNLPLSQLPRLCIFIPFQAALPLMSHSYRKGSPGQSRRLSTGSTTPAGVIPVPQPASGRAAGRRSRGEMTNGDKGGDAACGCQLAFVSLRTEEERN